MAGWTAAGTLWTVFLNLLKQNNLGPGAGGAQPGNHQRPKGLLPGGGRVSLPGAPDQRRRGRHHHHRIQQYGVQLEFTPTVLGRNKIAIKVHPIVSELDHLQDAVHHGGGYVVPGLRRREMNTQVEVNDGQTFSIAGLLRTNPGISSPSFRYWVMSRSWGPCSAPPNIRRTKQSWWPW